VLPVPPCGLALLSTPCPPVFARLKAACVFLWQTDPSDFPRPARHAFIQMSYLNSQSHCVGTHTCHLGTHRRALQHSCTCSSQDPVWSGARSESWLLPQNPPRPVETPHPPVCSLRRSLLRCPTMNSSATRTAAGYNPRIRSTHPNPLWTAAAVCLGLVSLWLCITLTSVKCSVWLDVRKHGTLRELVLSLARWRLSATTNLPRDAQNGISTCAIMIRVWTRCLRHPNVRRHS
jgi:hypothetical protein